METSAKSNNNGFKRLVQAILVIVILYLASSFFVVEKDVVITVNNKYSQVVKNSTQYYLESNTEVFSLDLTSFSSGSTKNLSQFENVEKGNCFKVDIVGYKTSFKPRRIKKLIPVDCI